MAVLILDHDRPLDQFFHIAMHILVVALHPPRQIGDSYKAAFAQGGQPFPTARGEDSQKLAHVGKAKAKLGSGRASRSKVSIIRTARSR